MESIAKRNYIIILLINLLYFQTGMLMSVMSALIPDIIRSYELSYTLTATLPFSFYIAFAVFCVPAGVANEKFSSKRVLLFAFMLAFFGALFFALFPNYFASLGSLFIIGTALAIVQVTVVPLLRVACGPENLAFHSTLTQLAYGVGAFMSPYIYSIITSCLINKTTAHGFFTRILLKLVPVNFEWVSVYWFIMLVIALAGILIMTVRFPIKEPARASIASGADYWSLLSNRYIIWYFIALTAYASCEQGIAAWMSKFFQEKHHLHPLTHGAQLLSWYWILLSCGCFIGLVLLKFFDSRKILAAFTLAASLGLAIALNGPMHWAKIAFPAVGIFLSVMWPIIISLAINSVKKNHSVLTGFLYTASVGGAIGPLIIGAGSDLMGLGLSLNFLFLPLTIVLITAFLAKPIFNNKTIS